MSDKVQRVSKAIEGVLWSNCYDAADDRQRAEITKAAEAAVAAMDDYLEFRIAKLDLGVRDILVVKVNERVSDITVGRIQEYIIRTCAVTNPILVLDAALDLAVLTREEIESRT